MNILQLYTPDIEIYSIDEAFLEFKEFDKHFSIREHCLEMKSKVQQWTSIPISIWLAPTKAFSKIRTSFWFIFSIKINNIKNKTL
ncbi:MULTISPECIES: hypothetical protein [unclassified Tenacibaculum]|uniref:Y-family DNA polymerase n=1 Tax=unclassified Tenacibaculum TaxID=2635139 RepID=UPI001F2676A6|nr:MULTISPECIES: hypothetical protein [unclassified Tenacibaculum]MCF2874027.1 hypothetical protein [Tenacibaculum sp. Cn5-1]MCF2934608.1 hypothetical protein [Tenacibaculum sp. Cn5-34]MCG7510818.1 hypothetical protein [Tenacibaculum sp. Cn5-46]